MVEINPLQLASQFQPKPPDTSVIDKLKAGAALRGIEDRATAARSTATDLSRLTGVLAPHGLSPSNIGADILDPIRGQIGGERGGNTAAALVKAGIRLPSGSGVVKPGDIYKKEFTPGFNLPGKDMNLALPRTTSTQKKGQQRTSQRFNEKTGVMETVVDTDEVKEEAQIKGSSPSNIKNAKQIQASVAEKLKAMGRTFKTIDIIREETDSTGKTIGVVVKIDGVEKTIPYDD